MAETKVEWTWRLRPDGTMAPGYTFNPWIGCTKVSDGCKFCYAERDFAIRRKRVKWGEAGTRIRTSESYWKGPIRWNRDAGLMKERRAVFCASLADVFEDRDELHPWRADLFELIRKTPNLDWLLLTKRPENVCGIYYDLVANNPNVWVGTSVENQETADLRIPLLAQIPAAVRFVSYEPALGPIRFNSWWLNEAVDWIIVGGESGHGAREFNLEWARSVIRQTRGTSCKVFVKQLGAHTVGPDPDSIIDIQDSKGGKMEEWPEDLCVREIPESRLTAATRGE